MEYKSTTIFSYGSLLNETSLRKTVPNARVVGVDRAQGFKRDFNFSSPYRHNKDTGVYSSVINVVDDKDFEIYGLVFEAEGQELDRLIHRERGYQLEEIVLSSGTQAKIFIARNNKCYSFIHDDPVQIEYLEMCLDGAKKLGEEVYGNFLDTTFIDDVSLRNYLS